MAKTSKTIPQKEKASSSQSAAEKTPVETRLEECVPGAYVLTSNFKVEKGSSVPGRCLGKDVVLRLPSIEEEASASVPKPVKDNKQKRASASEDPKPKTRMARKPRKNTIPLTIESILRLRDEDEEEGNDGSVLVARVKKTIDAPKAAESTVIYKAPPRTEEISDEGTGRVPESLEIEDASHRSQQTEGAIREAQSLGALEINQSHEGEDPFCDLFTGVEDVAGPSDVSVLFCEVQQDLNRGAVVHREACSWSRAELRKYEADLRRVMEERNALRLLFRQREEEIKDLRAELAKAHQYQTDLTEQVIIILKTHGLNPGMMANISISELQQKLEVIGKLCEEVDMIRAESLGWKDGMDRLVAEKETARSQLSSAKNQLQGIKEKSLVQSRKIEDLEARLASKLAKAKYDAKKAKANADIFVAIYRADAEAARVQARESAETANTRAHWVDELAKCRSQRETLEEIHAQGFDLTEEIKRAKYLETDAEALASDLDDYDGSKIGLKLTSVIAIWHLVPHFESDPFVDEGEDIRIASSTINISLAAGCSPYTILTPSDVWNLRTWWRVESTTLILWIHGFQKGVVPQVTFDYVELRFLDGPDHVYRQNYLAFGGFTCHIESV
ncbi:uncharacterized protein [Nicotiana tomentosiformis]|uniref:uncharacterized protein n=1 Tax=Nicotiana tomentosiformis TaxID=4098 RepID=UPI00388C8E8A